MTLPVPCRFIATFGLCYLLFCSSLLAQKTPPPAPSPFQCAVVELDPAQRNLLEAEAALALQVKRATQNKATGITYVPIRPHILRQTNGTGGMGLAKLNNVLALTNRYYLLNGSGIQFYFCGTTPDFVDNDALYSNYNRNNEQLMAGSHDVNNALNMYFVNATDEYYAGYASYPSFFLESTRIIIVNTNWEQLMGDKTIPHELGHAFNLIHTFGDNPGGTTELVTRGAGANCSTAGDLLCDTPADPYSKSNTGTNTVNSCLVYTGTATDAQGAVYTPSTTNLMSYYYSCSHDFTLDQYDRIQGGLAVRQNQRAYSLNCGPTAVNAPTNLIASLVNGNVHVTWTDNANNEMGYFIERATSPTGDFSPIGGSGPNSTLFTDTGANATYYYRVRPSNSTTDGISTVVGVTNGACRPVFTNGCSLNDGLNSVAINGTALSQNTGCSNPITSYSQFTTTTAYVSPGQTYTLSGTFLSGAQQGITIWADLNRNDSFSDPGEQLVQAGALSGSFSVSLALPTDVALGSLAVRVVAVKNGIPTSPCGNYSYGEAEDYLLTIIPLPCNDPLEPNNTYQTATTLAANVNYTSPDLCLNPPSDIDWFKWSYNGRVYYVLVYPFAYNGTGRYQLSLSVAGGILTVKTLAGSNGSTTDTYLKLYDSDGTTLLLEDDNSGDNGLSRIIYPLPGVCKAPTNVSVFGVNTSSAQLVWATTEAGQFQVRYRPINTNSWLTSVMLSSPALSLTGLSNGLTYEVQVQQVCPTSALSDFTTSTTFTTGCYAVSQFVDNVSSASAHLYWQNAGIGVLYELNYRQTGTTVWTSVSGLTATTYSLTGLTNNTNYEFRVRVLCEIGIFSDFKTPTPFYTSCNTPNYVSAIGLSGTQARVEWTGVVDGQTRYEVRYRLIGTTTWITATNPESVTNTYRNLTGLTPNSLYEWQVRTLCSDGNNSAFMPSRLLGTRACAVPYSLSASGIGSTTAILNWSSDEPGSTYTLRYRIAQTITWLYTFPALTPSPLALTGLTPNTTYEWEVLTQCTGTTSSSYAVGPSFTTLPLACTTMTTIRNGDWHDSGTWSCNRIPNSDDAVTIGHIVSVPAGIMGNALSIKYSTGGKLLFIAGSRVRLGL